MQNPLDKKKDFAVILTSADTTCTPKLRRLSLQTVKQHFPDPSVLPTRMNVKVINEAIRFDLRHTNDLLVDDGYEWILLGKAVGPLTMS